MRSDPEVKSLTPEPENVGHNPSDHANHAQAGLGKVDLNRPPSTSLNNHFQEQWSQPLKGSAQVGKVVDEAAPSPELSLKPTAEEEQAVRDDQSDGGEEAVEVIQDRRCGWLWSCELRQALMRITLLLAGILLGILAIVFSQSDAAEEGDPAGDDDDELVLKEWNWLALGSAMILAYFVALIVVQILRRALLSIYPSWAYYVSSSSNHLRWTVTSSIHVVAWYFLILHHSEPTVALSYTTQVFWLLLVVNALRLVSKLAKELSASFFERTTYWSLVSENLRREAFIWMSCPGCPVPKDAVLTYFQLGEATKSDPQVVRHCTRYFRKSGMTAYDNRTLSFLDPVVSNTTTPIEITSLDDMQALAEIIFDHVLARTRNQSERIEDDTTRHKLREKRMTRKNKTVGEPVVRTMLNAGQVRTSSRNVMLHLNSFGPQPNGAGKEMPTGVPSTNNAAPTRKFMRQGRITKEEFETSFLTAEEKTKVEVAQLWSYVFDPNKQGYVTIKSLKANMSRFHTERLGLGQTLKSSQAAVDRLGAVYNAVAFSIFIIVAALLFSFNSATSPYEVWLAITSLFLTLAIVFGSSLKQIVENIVFIFFQHTFDVGDLLKIDGVFYSVRRLELLSTILIKWNGNYIQMSNSQLSKKPILNLSRSGLYWEYCDIHVDVATADAEFMRKFRSTIQGKLQENSESFSGKHQIVVRGIDRPLQMRIEVFIEFSMRPTNMTKLFEDMGKFHEIVAEGLRAAKATESGVSGFAVQASAGDANTTVPFLAPAWALVHARTAAAIGLND